MPIAFNPPPLPTPDRALAATPEAGEDAANAGADPFAAVLTAATEALTGTCAGVEARSLVREPLVPPRTAGSSDDRVRTAPREDEESTLPDASALVAALQALLPPAPASAPVTLAMVLPGTSGSTRGAPAGPIAPLRTQGATDPSRLTPDPAGAPPPRPAMASVASATAVSPALAQPIAGEHLRVPSPVLPGQAASRPVPATTPRKDLPAEPAGTVPPPGLPAMQWTPAEHVAASLTAEGAALAEAALHATAPALAEPGRASTPRPDVDLAKVPDLPSLPPDVAAPRPAAVHTVVIATPAFTSTWRSDVVHEIAQMVVLRHDRAELHVTPPNLGPISVQVTMDAGQANLLVTAPQPATRDALELALPQLRDSLAQQGITLGQASVQDDRPQSFSAGTDDSRGFGTAGANTTGVRDDDAPVQAAVLRARGLIDLFA